jgi:hypothetical protein
VAAEMKGWGGGAFDNSGQSASIAAFRKEIPTALPDSVGTDGFSKR